MFDFGVTRYLGEAGAPAAATCSARIPSPTATFNPLIPDSDRHLFSVGVGKNYKHLSWDAAYQLGMGPSRSVAGDITPNDNGNYEFLSHALTINFGWHF